MKRTSTHRFFVYLLFFSIFVLSDAFAQIRHPAVAGQFYPSDPEQLSDLVNTYLEHAGKPQVEGKPIAFVVPHAGYPFSGQTAAHVYKVLYSQNVRTVILVGTGHHLGGKDAAIYPEGAFQTPLGQVKIDSAAAFALTKKYSFFKANLKAHEKEHSLETQLPFLQKVLRDFKIVPILVGDTDLKHVLEMGRALAEAAKENNASGKPTVIIASTDLSHYPKREDAVRVDMETLRAMHRLDVQASWETDEKLMNEQIPQLACTMCGAKAAMIVLSAAKVLGANHTTVLKYANSAGVPFGDPNQVVGYGAVVFSDRAASSDHSFQETADKALQLPEAHQALADNPTFSAQEQKALLQIARETIETGVQTGEPAGGNLEERKGEKTALFVTLMKKGELRGCMGSPVPVLPLGQAVRRYAFDAANRDPRFPRVKADEISQLDIEISILSPLEAVKNAEAIQPRRHGVLLSYHGHSGLFLPQVWDDIPDKVNFLSALAYQKAGAPAFAWKEPDAELYVFTVEKFKESDF